MGGPLMWDGWGLAVPRWPAAVTVGGLALGGLVGATRGRGLHRGKETVTGRRTRRSRRRPEPPERS